MYAPFVHVGSVPVTARRVRIAFCLSVGIAIGLSPLAAQTGGPAMLRDIATPPDPFATMLIYGPIHFVALGGISYYTAWDANRGLELWRTDGTPAGTHVVRDICPGSCNGRIWPELIASGGLLFFAAEDAAHGVELWRSDGTAAGTSLVKDVQPGLQPSYPSFLTAAMNGVYFVARDDPHGYELWWSDGSDAGTYLVRDLLPGNPVDPSTGEDPGPTHLAMLDPATLLFAANDGVHGRELWRTDGSEGGTVLVEDVVPGADDGFTVYQPGPFRLAGPAVAGGRYYFAGHVGGGSYDEVPWVSDGTQSGTVPLVNAPPFSGWQLHSLFAFDDVVLFTGGPASAGTTASSSTLWRSDGTSAGTYPLGDATNGGEALIPRAFGRFADKVYFAGSQASTGRELWSTDGTVVGTRLVADVIAGAASGLEWTFTGIAAGGDRVYFPADDGVRGVELWSTDGTSGGTAIVADLAPGEASSLQPLERPTLPGTQGSSLLWRSLEPDGWVVRSVDTTTGTVGALQRTDDRPGSAPHCAIWQCPTAVSTPTGFAFVGSDAQHGAEPWVTDGSPAGTQILQDAIAGPEGSMSGFLALASLPDALLMVLRDPDPTTWRTQVWSASEAGLVQLTSHTGVGGPSGAVSSLGPGQPAPASSRMVSRPAPPAAGPAAR